MAKSLEKIEKDYNRIFDKIGAIAAVVTGATKSATDLEEQNIFAAKEAGKEAGELRAKGHSGKALSDFKTEKPVAAMMKLAIDGQKTIKKHLAKVDGKLASEHKKLSQELDKIKNELSEEIANRDKKATRKVFKIKSKSLPDMKKLLKRIEKEEEALTEDVEYDLENAKDALSANYMAAFERHFLDTLGKTKKQLQADDVFERGPQALNHGALRTYKKKATAIRSAVKKSCAEALKALRAGGATKPSLDEAAKQYKDLVKMMKFIAAGKVIADKGMREAKRNKQADRVKKLTQSLKLIDEIQAINHDAKTMLLKTTQATFKLKKAG